MKVIGLPLASTSPLRRGTFVTWIGGLNVVGRMVVKRFLAGRKKGGSGGAVGVDAVVVRGGGGGSVVRFVCGSSNLVIGGFVKRLCK